VVERQWFPRHVIGESLLPRCNRLLHEAGLLAAVEARGYLPKHGSLFLRGPDRQRFVFRDSIDGDAPSSFQVPRDDFDQTLVTAARSLGAEIRFGHEVRGVDIDPDGTTVRLLDDQGEPRDVRARLVIDASGPARILGRALGLDEPPRFPARTSLYTHVEGDLRPDGEEEGDVWIVLHPRGAWLWLIPFSNGRTSVGVVADPDLLAPRPGVTDRELLWGFLRDEPSAWGRLRKATPVQPTRRLQGWTTQTQRLVGPGWVVAGNAGDFLDPVFSSGVMLALESGSRAAALAARHLRGEAVDWEGDYQEPLRRAVGIFRVFVEAWYTGELATIFFSPVKRPQNLREITSILGGNVFNERNPLVARDPRAGIDRLLGLIARHTPG
jgi:flavin-dependent dehydrogenase